MRKSRTFCDLCGKELAVGEESRTQNWYLFNNTSRKIAKFDMCEITDIGTSTDICRECEESLEKWVESRMPQADCSWMKAEK